MVTKVKLLDDTVIIPTGSVATTQGASDNTTKVATTAYVTTALANLADSAPSTLNTLNELAAALGDDANFSTTVTNSIATKLPLAGGTLTGDVQAPGLYVGSTNTSFDFYNNGTSYLNGAVTVDDNLTVNGSLNVVPTAATGLTYAVDGTNSYINFKANSVGDSVQLYAGQSSGGFFSIGTKNSSGTLAERMRIDAIGNVGIGGAPHASGRLLVTNGGTNQVVLKGASGTTNLNIGNFVGGGYISNNYYYSSGHQADDNSKGAFEVFIGDDNYGINYHAAGAAGTRRRDFAIDNGGNVGIGTSVVTSPGLWYDANPGYLAISHWATPPTPAAILHLSDNSNDLDVPQIRIEGRENVGDTKLDISVKDAGVRLNLIEGPGGDASNGYGLMEFKTNAAINTSNPTRGGFKFITPANANNLVITNTGNVGIGIATPSEMLHINKTSGTGSFIRFQDTGGSGVYIGGRAEIMEMYTNGSEKMRINASGNVGIGDQNPQHPLKVHLTNGEIAMFGSNDMNSPGRYAGIGLGQVLANSTAHQKVSLVTEGRNDGNYRQNFHILVDAAADNGYAVLADKKFTIDGVYGTISMPLQPSFMCYPAANYSQAGGSQKVYWTGEAHDVNNWYNNANHRFTAPVAGNYLFMGDLSLQATTLGQTYIGIGIRINGAGNIFYGGWAAKTGSSNQYEKVNSTIIKQLAANDYVEIYVELSSTTTVLGGSGGALSRMSGQLLS